MSVQLIVDTTRVSDSVAMYCTTSGFAFGPVFDSEDEAMSFLGFCPEDPRTYSDRELEDLVGNWRTIWDGITA